MRPLRLRRNGVFLVLTAEAIDAALGIHQLLLAGIEGMAIRANVDCEIAAGGAGDELVPAGADDCRAGVGGGDAFFHVPRPSLPCRVDARFSVIWGPTQVGDAIE